MNTADLQVPDLLRRFSSAPHCSVGRLQDFEVTLQTNDLDLVSSLQAVGQTSSDTQNNSPLFVKIVRDCESLADVSKPTVLSAWPLTTLLCGTGTVLTLDCERREILGFVAAGISADRVIHELLPILLQHLRDPRQPALHASVTDGL